MGHRRPRALDLHFESDSPSLHASKFLIAVLACSASLSRMSKPFMHVRMHLHTLTHSHRTTTVAADSCYANARIAWKRHASLGRDTCMGACV